jgi:hypothetical protein
MTAGTMERKRTGEMATLDRTGDTKVIWDKDNEDEVEAARATFDRLTKDKKYTAFHVTGKDGKKGERMRAFDPEAERIILVPQMVGG